ncbi:MAG TPA: hypothetical protein VJ761_20105 [Ktedonobacteraceae bacterium]|nr:hypothetical protein [Ktedonobacteraceae bacterium]
MCSISWNKNHLEAVLTQVLDLPEQYTQDQRHLLEAYQGLCKQILTQTWRPPSSEGGVADRDYDIISGAAGVLSYLISIEQPDEVILTAVGHIPHYLTWLAEPGQPVGKERWYIPSATG